tara:strand:- start:161 stop:655 length:495 start_codon:yes stop_codon:yes gene_type:complete
VNKIVVIDDWLDLEFCDHLSYHILYCLPHIYGHSSNSSEGSQRFYRVEFGEENFHVKYMCRKLNREVFKENHQVIRAYANVQFKGMDGSFHEDDGDFTALYMVTPTLKNSGCFEYDDGESVKKIDFVQNRLIWFPGSKLPHRGMSPDTDTPRVTISFKINKGVN